jgi:exodeoxyribonuclease V alpha subunit
MHVQVTGIVARREFGIIADAVIVEVDHERRGESVRIKASRDALLGEPVVGETWDVDGASRPTAWGPQIDATRAVRVLPSGVLICDFLAAHVPGIGPERARRLWQYFGSELTTSLGSHDHIGLIAGIVAPDRPVLGVRLATLLVRTWSEAAGEARLAEWLSSHGFDDPRLVRQLSRILGADAADRLIANPYVLVPILPWSKVDRIGLRVLAETGSAHPHGDLRRLVGAVDVAVKRAVAEGHTVLDEGALRAGVAAALGLRPTSPRVTAAIAAGERNTAILAFRTVWRAPGCALLEQAVADRLREMLDEAYPQPVPVPSEALEGILDRLGRAGRPLHPEQRQAVLTLLGRPVAVLQGGAGVGKTHTLGALCDAWEELGGRLALMALAGKAALRLSRATGRLARTLARTLAELGRREDLGRQMWEDDLDANKLIRIQAQLKGLAEIDPRTLVVIDEASMVDVATMHRLLRRMPDGARLLLVGDHAQLPPVGIGIVFHRLVHDPAITTRLATVHRQAAQTGIPDAAAAVKAGRLPSFAAYAGKGSGVSLVPCRAPDLAATVERIFVELGGAPDGVLIVTATNRGVAGVDALNGALHGRYVGTTGLPEIKGHLGRAFCSGEPVIHLRNDYGKGLFNGLLGSVQGIDVQTRSCSVLFDGEAGPHAFAADDLIDLALAYAITCHKAQGSSASRIVIPLYASRVLDPSWIYTAMTRAEAQVVFVGDISLLESALRQPWKAEQRRVGFEWHPDLRGPNAGGRRL